MIVTYYAATIYQNYVHLSPFLSRLLAACNGTEYFLASWIAVFTIEKFGRRQLMLFGAAGQSLSMVVLAIVNYLASTGSGGQGPGIAATLFLFVFNTFFAIGWLGMVNTVYSENLEARLTRCRRGSTRQRLFRYVFVRLQMRCQPVPIGK